jgi:hypothetical protein
MQKYDEGDTLFGAPNLLHSFVIVIFLCYGINVSVYNNILQP